MSRMRVLFVTRYVDHVLLYLLDALAGHVRLKVVYDFDNGWNDDLASLGVDTLRLVARSRFDRRYRNALETLYRDEPFDLVHCFHGNAELANLIVWNRRGLPLIGYRGRIGHLKLRESPAAYWSVRNPGLAAVVANSTAVANYLRSFKWLRPRNVHVIPTGVNLAWIRERRVEPYALRSRLGIADDALLVMSMGSLRPVKNFGLEVAAAERLAAANVEFVHLGDALGWDRRTQALSNLHYLPFERNPFPVIAAADLFLTTSHEEAFSRASLEAMACGKAVVGPRAGGSLDLIEDGSTGAFYTPDDADDLVAKLRPYIDSRRLALLHGDNALASVERRFTTQRMAESYLALYDQTLRATLTPTDSAS